MRFLSNMFAIGATASVAVGCSGDNAPSERTGTATPDLVAGTYTGVALSAPGTAAAQSAFRQTPPGSLPPGRPRRLPAPPNHIGCYEGTRNGWRPVACTPHDTARYGLPELTLAYAPPAGATEYPFRFGQVEAVFVAVGVENNVLPPEKGSVTTPNALSVQANTNVFTGSNGDRDWVQFVLQSMDGGSYACVWNIDVTVANASSDTEGYAPKCVFPAKRAGAYLPFDYADVGGATYLDDTGAPAIGMVAQFNWVPAGETGLYSVVAPDTFGLAPHWTNLSGTVYGMGDRSRAVFTDTSVVTRVVAGSCVAASGPVGGIPWPGICPLQPRLRPDTRVFNLDVTGETSNLTAHAPTPLTALNDDLVSIQYMSSTAAGRACLPSGPHAFVRDTEEDNGAIPSNLGGQPFWESPDLLVVPQGAAVDLYAVSTETLITPGQKYDIYVRINNDYGCEDVTNARASVYLADPSALSARWVAVTQGYVGDAKHPDGVTVPAASLALLGPISFTAPTSGFGNGHRCLLAAIMANGEAAPASEFDAPASYQVAQRNVEFSNCAYPLTNATTTDGSLTLTLTARGVAPTAKKVQAVFDDPTGAWFGAWNGGAGYSVAANGGKTTVTLAQRSVTLAAVPLAAGQSPSAVVNIHLSPSDPTTTVDLFATLADAGGKALVANGGSCRRQAPYLIP
jgi:hypothetical protein